MRLHPVIPMVVRTLMRPATIGGFDLPAGATVGPSILIAHQPRGQPPRPRAVRPERFLGHNPPTNTWIPFGGGVRRCIGAGFSLMEGVAVLREVLTAYDVEAVGADGPRSATSPACPATAPGSGSAVHRSEGALPGRPASAEVGPAPWAPGGATIVRVTGGPFRGAAHGRHPAADLARLPAAVPGRHGLLPRRDGHLRRDPFQIYTLTGSNFAVGAIGLVELVPLVVFGLYGGALADHVDRRRLLSGRASAQAVLTAVLAVNAFRDEPERLGDLRGRRRCWPSTSRAAAALAARR